MVDQAKMNTAPRPRQSLGQNLSGFTHDLLNLMELQVKLLTLDIKESMKGIGPGAATIACGVMAGIGAVPLLLVTIALALTEFAGWSRSAAFGATTGLGLLAGALCGYLGWKKLVKALSVLERSRSEFVETLEWVKQSVKPTNESNGNGYDRRV